MTNIYYKFINSKLYDVLLDIQITIAGFFQTIRYTIADIVYEKEFQKASLNEKLDLIENEIRFQKSMENDYEND